MPKGSAVALNLKDLENRIRKKTAVISVIGLGYGGLPLALAFAEAGFKVIGVDLDKKKVNSINRGTSYLLDIKSAQLKKPVAAGLLKATSEGMNIIKVIQY
jgi:UDP-N-acetyl-D-glucosamine dehydrogenase